MPLALLLPLIASGVATVGNFFGGLLNRNARARANRRNIAFQREVNVKNRKFAVSQFRREKSAAIDLWNLQNAYNTPSAQMKRLTAAGLNSNLVYGGGATTLASAPSTPSASMSTANAPSVLPESLGSAVRGISSGLGSYFSFRNQKLQGDLVDSKVVNNVLSAYGKGIDNDIANATKGTVISMVNERLSNLKADTTGKNLRNSISRVEANLKKTYGEKRVLRELKMMAAKIKKIGVDTGISNYNYSNMQKFGIFPSDSIIRRTLLKNLINQGVDPNDFIGWLLGKFGLSGHDKDAPSLIGRGIRYFLK